MEFVEQARKSLESLQAADSRRYDFIEQTLEKTQAIVLEKIELEARLKESDYVRTNYRRDFESSQRKVAALETSMNRGTFILVLVDGDAAPFLDEFLKNGVAGGEAAARELRRAVTQYIEEKTNVAPDINVFVQVYCKMQYMNKTYRDLGTIQGECSLYNFVQGFNRVHRLCAYVDAGNDKEGADNKVQNIMELFVNNVHCKHIVLCASSDKSYTGFLRQFVDYASSRITLVEAIPFPRNFAEVAVNFLTTEFSSVFRQSKLPMAPLASSASLQTSRPEIPSYASTVAKQSVPAQAENSLDSTPVMLHRSSTIAHDPQKVWINKDNQRVDLRLPLFDKNVALTLRGRKFCNRHYLTYCRGCDYDHETELNPAERAALRSIARLSICGAGSACRDKNCVAAHMCTYGENCNQPDTCRYPRWMHGLDARPAQEFIG